jgi:hypothetical protein
VEVVTSRSELPVTGEETAQGSPSSLLLAALVMAAFGCAAVLMARLRMEERDPELFSDI